MDNHQQANTSGPREDPPEDTTGVARSLPSTTAPRRKKDPSIKAKRSQGGSVTAGQAQWVPSTTNSLSFAPRGRTNSEQREAHDADNVRAVEEGLGETVSEESLPAHVILEVEDRQKRENNTTTSSKIPMKFVVIGIAFFVVVTGLGAAVIVGVLLYQKQSNESLLVLTKAPTATPSFPLSIPPSATPTLSPIKVREELQDMIHSYTVARVQGADPPYPPMGTWDVSNLTDMSELFMPSDISRYMQFFNEDISGWNVSRVTSMSRTFQLCFEFDQDLSRWDMSRVETMSGMFFDNKVFNHEIGRWNVSKVTNMKWLFWGAISFNQDLSKWDVSKVKSMQHTFKNAVQFNGDIGCWNTSSVTTFSNMFENAIHFNQDLHGWETGNAISFRGMFSVYEYNAFGENLDWSVLEDWSTFNGDIAKWNTSKVTDMSMVFHRARAFNSDISRWNTSNVRDMRNMFSLTMSFNQDISLWDTSNVQDMQSMFFWAHAFNQDISSWNTSNVLDMSQMFYFANEFAQDLCQWDVSRVLSFNYIVGPNSSMGNISNCSWAQGGFGK